MNPKILLYVVTAFYLLAGVVTIILSWSLPTMTWQNAILFTLIAVLVLICASLQMWGIERYVAFAAAIPDDKPAESAASS